MQRTLTRMDAILAAKHREARAMEQLIRRREAHVCARRHSVSTRCPWWRRIFNR